MSPEEAHQQQRVGLGRLQAGEAHGPQNWTLDLLHLFRRYYSQDVKTNWGILKVHPMSSLFSRAKQLS